jgi:glutathione S-transferase
MGEGQPGRGARMKLYVCWGTFGDKGHPCGKAYKALKGAGHDPEVQKVRGWAALPDAFNRGRGEVVELTGESTVPVLVTDSGEVVKESDAIADWAKAHRAAAAGQEA